MELCSSDTNGSFTGNFSEPLSTLCSRMWKTPVSFSGRVLKETAKVLLRSALSKYNSRAPHFLCRRV